VSRVLDVAARVPGREPDVGDAVVARVRRVELAMEAPDHAYVGARGAERLASGEGSCVGDLYSSQFRKGISGTRQHEQKEQNSQHVDRKCPAVATAGQHVERPNLHGTCWNLHGARGTN